MQDSNNMQTPTNFTYVSPTKFITIKNPPVIKEEHKASKKRSYDEMLYQNNESSNNFIELFKDLKLIEKNKYVIHI